MNSLPPLNDLISAVSCSLTEGNGAATITRHLIGHLPLKTGRLVVCDPFGNLDDREFSARFQSGVYPVILGIADRPNDSKISIYSMVQFHKSRPIKWEVAPTDGTSAKDADFSFPGDSG
jgi:hypothetical protein